MNSVYEPLKQDIERERLALWSGYLKHSIIRSQFIGSTQKSVVYQLFGQSKNFIAKLSQDKDSLYREVCVNQYLDQKQFMPDRRPHVMCFEKILDGFCIVFSDDRLRELDKGTYFASQAMEILSQFHQLSYRDLPSLCCSHTPPIEAVAREALELDIHRLEPSMRDCGIKNASRKKILQLYSELQTINLIEMQTSETICHGDAHAGNFLWSYEHKSLFLIDWEYVHIDTPYFDLFQFIDATSPYKTLQNRVGRKYILEAYRRKNIESGGRPGAGEAFFRGYLLYASFHLFWIVQRIWYDLNKNQLETSALMRQLVETYKRLALISRDLERL